MSAAICAARDAAWRALPADTQTRAVALRGSRSARILIPCRDYAGALGCGAAAGELCREAAPVPPEPRSATDAAQDASAVPLPPMATVWEPPAWHGVTLWRGRVGEAWGLVSWHDGLMVPVPRVWAAYSGGMWWRLAFDNEREAILAAWAMAERAKADDLRAAACVLLAAVADLADKREREVDTEGDHAAVGLAEDALRALVSP